VVIGGAIAPCWHLGCLPRGRALFVTPMIAYLVTWSTGAGLFESVAEAPWPVWPAFGASPPPEAFMPSIAALRQLLLSFSLCFLLLSPSFERAREVKRGRWGRVLPSPFSISGMGATLFFVCWRVACYLSVSSQRCKLSGRYVRLQRRRGQRSGRPRWGRCQRIRLRCEA
jgi:hypothetical protein